MKANKYGLGMLLMALLLGGSTMGCEESEAELDEAADDVADGVDEAVDELDESADDVADGIDDAVEDAEH